MTKFRYRTNSFALWRALQVMAVILAKKHNKEAGDFDRNLLRARAFLILHRVWVGLCCCAITLCPKQKVKRGINHEVLRGSKFQLESAADVRT